MHELDSGGGGLGNGLVRGRSLGQQGPSCGAAIATAIGTALLDASFFVGVGEAIELARISRLVGREAISLARRGLWRQTGHLAYQASLLARDASSAVNVGNLVRDVGGIGFTTTAAGFSGGGVAVGDRHRARVSDVNTSFNRLDGNPVGFGLRDGLFRVRDGSCVG